MNGVLEPAIEQLRALGGWSLTSKVPLRYAKRFIEVVSNQSNYKRTKPFSSFAQSAGPEKVLKAIKVNASVLQKKYTSIRNVIIMVDLCTDNH